MQRVIIQVLNQLTNLQQTTLKKCNKTILLKDHKLKIVESIAAKGGIAHHKQFIILSQLFQKSSAAESSESVCMWERVNALYKHMF